MITQAILNGQPVVIKEVSVPPTAQLIVQAANDAKTAAETARDAASTSASNASTSATNAANSASTSATSATSANTSASTATTQATNAATSAANSEAYASKLASFSIFGGVGNGETNNNTAFASAEASDYEAIYLPSGNYITTTFVPLKKYYGFGLVNGKPLFGWQRINPLPQAQRVWQKIRNQAEDVYFIIIGDSTGNAPTEWVHLLAEKLADYVLTHTIMYRLFIDGTGWNTAEQLSTGSSGKIIYVDNCSVSGSTERLMTGANNANIYNSGRVYDFAIMSHGHNEGTGVPYETILAGFTEGIVTLMHDNPQAAYAITLQNPRRDVPAHSARCVKAWRDIATLYGIGMIDVYSVFQTLGVPAALYLDDIHPNDLGEQIWSEVVWSALSESMNSDGVPSVQNPMLGAVVNYAPNAVFNLWSTDHPTSWDLTNSTATQDRSIKETFAYSVKLVSTSASNPNLGTDISNHLPALRGQWFTVMARVWRPAVSGTSTGRVQVIGTVGGTTTSRSKATEGVDGWHWECVHKFIAANETGLAVKILADSVNVGGICYIDRVSFVAGLVAREPDFANQASPQLSNIYNNLTVGIPSGFDGALTPTGNNLVLTGATTQARAYANLEFLVVGQSYTLSWTRSGVQTGDVYIRDGVNGNGTSIATTNYEIAGGSLTFTATKTTMCVLFTMDGAFTGFTANSISVAAATSTTDYVWASRPSASANANSRIFVTDVGRGAWFRSDGTDWIPEAGRIVLYNGYPNASTSGSGTNEETLLTKTIPADLLGRFGGLESVQVWNTTRNISTKTARVKIGGISYSSQQGTTTSNNNMVNKIHMWQSGAGTQIGGTLISGGFGSGSGASVTSSITTTNAFDVAWTGQAGISGDVVTLKTVRLEAVW